MDPDEFRRHAHVLVDWMADYLRDVGTLPVTPAVAPGDIRRQVPAAPPLDPEPFEALFGDFQRVILPGMTHWNHPGWFAYFPGNNSPPSILGEMLTATLGAQCMSWATSPAATELEQVVMDWLRQMMDLPAGFVGVIQDTASTATLVALLSARERATGGKAGAAGLAAAGTPLAVYASREAHSSIDKAVKLAGYGLDLLRPIETDEVYALRPDALALALEADRNAGIRPACVVASVGTTSSTAIDPLRPIGELCRRSGAWLHVDAAYAGAAAIVAELRPLFDGIEAADSIVFNPHKWLLTNFDCTAYFVRDPAALLSTFQATPEYLRTAYDADVVNFRDWGIQLGRRFRALKLWFVIRHYGVEGLQHHIRQHVAWAQKFAGWVRKDERFELAAPAPLNLVCFRHRGGDQINQSLMDHLNRSGDLYLTHTRLDSRLTLRLCVGQTNTTERHVEKAWKRIQEEAAKLG